MHVLMLSNIFVHSQFLKFDKPEKNAVWQPRNVILRKLSV